MEIEILKQLPNLGVGVAAVVVTYLVMKVALGHLAASHSAFVTYVEANNHKTTEILVQARDNIKESTDVLRDVGAVMIQVRDTMIGGQNGNRRSTTRRKS